MNTTAARRITAALALSGALFGLGAGMANAATPAAPAPVSAVSLSPAQSSGSTGIKMVITNNSDQDMTLAGVTNPYGHMQDRPAQILAAHSSTTASDYTDAGNGALLDVQYSTPNGDTLEFHASVPLAGFDSATGTSTDPAYIVNTTQAGTGWHPTDAFTITAS